MCVLEVGGGACLRLKQHATHIGCARACGFKLELEEKRKKTQYVHGTTTTTRKTARKKEEKKEIKQT